MESEKWWKIESFRNGIRKLLDFWKFLGMESYFFVGGGESDLFDLSDSSDLSDVSDLSDHQLVDS